MIRVSNKTRLIASLFGKVVLTVLIGFISISAVILASYKPVYLVLINDVEKGYITSKSKMQNNIEEYLQKGDSEKVGYILLNDRPEYDFSLVKKDVQTKDEEILAGIIESCDIYYKVYAVNVNDEEVCLVDSLVEAQKVVDEVNKEQEDYTKKATIKISEKYEKEYDAIDDIEVAIKDIIEPIKKENEKLVKKYTSYASVKTVSKSVLDALLTSDKKLTFGYPVKGYVVTSRYGWRRSGFHTGIDYALAYGSPIYASEDGVVTCAKWSGNYGYLVKIQHSGGFETRYAHCSRFAVSVGDEVKKGDVIAYVGSTGNSTGPHVHLEIRYGGKSIDPETLVQ
ncbi:MAG: M23 family metallopeptidase [Clostridia bacterium]|nr:M23 family metallopeptidase [Clostridia bacterium]